MKLIESEIQQSSEHPLKQSLGKTITLKGKAINRKLGAVLEHKDYHIWIKGLSAWPEGYYRGGDDGKEIIVTGTVVEAYDLPVFIYKEGDPIRAGMPVPEGTDLRKASHRYILDKASWKLKKHSQLEER